ncbi:MAG: hypothetical protein GXP30_03930, partial [Verrucomicrobia bacterium]|nr:hypothetical protein [Verrucomicrobiota bacterium]
MPSPRLTLLIAFACTSACLFQQPCVAQNKKKESPDWAVLEKAPDQKPLPNTKALTDTSDLSSKMIAGIDRFLLKQIAQAKTN